MGDSSIWYSVAGDDERHEFELNDDSTPIGEDADVDLQRAEDAASFFYHYCDSCFEWPITVHLYAEESGPSLAKFRVDLISRPGFNATAI